VPDIERPPPNRWNIARRNGENPRVDAGPAEQDGLPKKDEDVDRGGDEREDQTTAVIAPVRLTTKNVQVGLSTVNVCRAWGGIAMDEPGPRS